MTEQQCKKMLRSYLVIKSDIRALRAMIDEDKANLYSISAVLLDGLPKGSGISRPTERKAIQADKLYAGFEKKIVDMQAALVEIEAMIELVDGWERTILRLKYQNGWTWDKFEAMYDLGEFRYTERQARRIHNNAIKKILKSYG